VGRVKVIFSLPPHLLPTPSATPVHLAYVDWFRPFKAKEAATGLYTTAPSVRHGEVQSEVIDVGRIIRSCHLVPKFGTEIKVTPDTVFEKYTSMYVNPWLDEHTFVLFRT
jgi:hypothetical protein